MGDKAHNPAHTLPVLCYYETNAARVSGDGFLYHIPGLERLVGLPPHSDDDPALGSSAEGGEDSVQLVVHGSQETPRRWVAPRLRRFWESG